MGKKMSEKNQKALMRLLLMGAPGTVTVDPILSFKESEAARLRKDFDSYFQQTVRMDSVEDTPFITQERGGKSLPVCPTKPGVQLNLPIQPDFTRAVSLNDPIRFPDEIRLRSKCAGAMPTDKFGFKPWTRYYRWVLA